MHTCKKEIPSARGLGTGPRRRRRFRPERQRVPKSQCLGWNRRASTCVRRSGREGIYRVWDLIDKRNRFRRWQEAGELYFEDLQQELLELDELLRPGGF